jgi:4,4'-diaponeurosporenoate glycosyltransferase
MLSVNLLPWAFGLFFGVLLFLRWPVLPEEAQVEEDIRISVIIPARNEAENLPGLLQDLKEQSRLPHEVLCIDDQSTDETAEVARLHGARVIAVKEKPEDWTGKTYACEYGACQASGDLLLFLDADLRLGPQAIKKLTAAYQKHHCVISVQPYHIVDKAYEQLSLFFNLILIAANGVGLPFSTRGIGLFGPVILISAEDYHRLGGYLSAKLSVAEDLVLGEAMKNKAMAFKLFLGAADIKFRMYRRGIADLISGWTKNFATGALKTPAYLFLMIIMWLGALTSSFCLFIGALTQGFTWQTGLYFSLYVLSVINLAIPARKAGSFRIGTLILYPLTLLGFYLIFLSSLIKRLLGRKVMWKGREINLRR